MIQPSIMRFDRDGWKQTPSITLNEGDLIYHQRTLLEVTEKPKMVGEKVQISAKPADVADEPIVVAVGGNWRERQATTAVMDYTNAACLDFGDGTHMIAELEAGPGAIFSPRLTAKELEAWCLENLERFEAFFEANEAALDAGAIVKMDPWWETQTDTAETRQTPGR